MLVGTSFGGLLGVEDVAARPIYSVNSAPAMAPVTGRVYAPGERNVIVCDMGGTSFDVSLVRDGYIKFTRETWLGGQFTGHMTGLSAVDIKNIGAGGGSIAWIDAGGLLRVGPQSAGAQPGPACYGAGGTEPTVTDAAVVLGYIDPDYFLGGRMRLSAQAARDVVARDIAEPIGIDVESAAHAILTIANEHMVGAIKDITINEGLDPRGSLVLAGGGAGGMTIGRIAEELGCDRVLDAAHGRHAVGLWRVVLGHRHRVQREPASRHQPLRLRRGQPRARAPRRADRRVLRSPGHDRASERHSEFFVEARYPYQVWELEVPLAGRAVRGIQRMWRRWSEGFHRVHERVFAVSEPGQHIECIYWKGRATARLREAGVGARGAGRRPSGPTRPPYAGRGLDRRPRSRRRASRRTACLSGHRLVGPAIILEPTTTVVVYPGWVGTVTDTGDYLMTRGG